jgi:hypothetical protein
MRHADIRTTINIYGDVVTDEMAVASGKVTRLALNGRETAGKRQGSRAKAFVLAEACASRTHRRRGDPPPAGFEDREVHRSPCASEIHRQRSSHGFTQIFTDLNPKNKT